MQYLDVYSKALKALPGSITEHIRASFDVEDCVKKRRSLTSQLLKEVT